MITDQKFYLPGGLTNGQGSLPVAITAQIGQSRRLHMSKPDSCEIISVSENKIFYEFLHVCIEQKAPIHQSNIYRQITILQSIFRGHPRNIPVKLFQNLTSGFGEKSFLRISSCPYSAKSPHSPEPYL